MSSVEEVIRTKRAVRQFAATPPPDAAVEAILRAGHYAQSSKNGQPWHFIAIRDRETLRRLSQTGDFAGHLAGAALGVALVAPVDEPERDRWIMFDLGQAASYMQLEAWELGIGSCIATIYHPEQAAALLGIPDGYRCDVAISFGYPAESQQRAPRPGGRKPLSEIVHWERW
jgi:nitroreductase